MAGVRSSVNDLRPNDLTPAATGNSSHVKEIFESFFLKR
jgi:hypothetical protein